MGEGLRSWVREMGEALTRFRGHHGSRNASSEEDRSAATSPWLLAQGPLHETASTSAPLALVSVGMDNPSEAAVHELSPIGRSVLNINQEVAAAAPPHFLIRSRSSGNYDLQAQRRLELFMADLEAGEQGVGAQRIGGGAAAPVQEPSALVSVGMEETSEAAGHELSPIGRSVLNRSRNGDDLVSPAVIALLLRNWWRGYDLQTQRRLELFMADLEAGGQGVDARRTGGGAAAPVQEPSSEVRKMLKSVMVQAYAAFLPACVTAYPLLKDTPDHVKFAIFGGLAFITVGLFAGILSRSVARRGLAIRLVSCSAIAVLTFSVASQLAARTDIVLTALVGMALNLIIMLLPFESR